MKLLLAAVGVSIGLGLTANGGPPPAPKQPLLPPAPHAKRINAAELTPVVQRYCAASCHSATQKRGNLSLADFKVEGAPGDVERAERIIRKLRTDMMPPPGSRRPRGDPLTMLADALEQTIDNSGPVNPGSRVFQRLNRAEYGAVVRDLLGLEIHAGDYLPLDTKSANFDNISAAQLLSPTLLEAYLNAASAVSRIAIGDRNPVFAQATYKTSPFASQHPWDHVEGTPYGTRGGLVVTHNFPADAEYEFRMNVAGGIGLKLEDIDVSIDGERVALLMYERGIAQNGGSADAPLGADYIRTDPIKVKAGQHKVSVAFVARTLGPYEDLIKPHDWSRASGGSAAAGSTEPPAIMEVQVNGPRNVTGLSDSESRKRIFSCRPAAKAAQRACAAQIVTRLGERAYRRPLTPRDRDALLAFYDKGAAASPTNAFEDGVRMTLQAMLASPYFVFRIEPTPAGVAEGKDYAVSDVDLASRLSFFLWGTMPDDRLLSLAKTGRLSDRLTYEREVKRMLADPRAMALSKRFAAQWLRLPDLDLVHPDAFFFPDFDQGLADAMKRETELFFEDIVRNDRSVLELFSADWTYVNERLAKHYGIPNVAGTDFRRVNYPDETRRGILGQGSVLVQTSLGNRTSPVLRGKWVMEVLLGSPPPPPPPNVPDLEQTEGTREGKVLTTRERMEMHRANPTCKSCHQFMDPLGLALDNFDVTGRLRFRENGAALDTRGNTYDGTAVASAADLNRWLVSRPTPLVRNFAENMFAYALGRRVEDFDQPAIRAVVRDAAAKNYKLSSFVHGVATSKAFRQRRVEAVADQ
jgi:Protein of unknown function (DUF1592)/Protein of unknown function (DUF1588)/Protein of unknown function (DUF1595)/Protein of unknown function (DUF1585)/Protein of unknown function (DUF1587)